jgi:branched-chain amino acid transport system permease protein
MTGTGDLYLELRDVSKVFGGVFAVNNLNSNFSKGSVTSIIGPNGAGKTTVLNLITGVLPFDKGEIFFKGREISKLGPSQICSLGVARTFQDLQLFNFLSVLENVTVGYHRWYRSNLAEILLHIGRFMKEEKEAIDQAMEILSLFHLERKAFELPSSLPLRDRKLLGMARALATKPELLLLDEPVGGLSTEEVKEVAETILKIRDQGVTVLLIEHRMELVMDTSDWIIVLNFGEKIAEGTPYEIQRNEQVINAYLGGEAEAAEYDN